MLVHQNRQWWLDDEHRPAPIPCGYRPYSLFPFIVRDITVPQKEGSDVYAVLEMIIHGGKYLEKIWKIGEYEPKHTSTFRLIFQSLQRTLSNEEVSQTVKEIEKYINEALKQSV